MELLWSALALGLMGSFHCAGMCGPIAIAIPLQGKTIPLKIAGGWLYNIGRAITYAIMGALFGLLGKGLHLVGFQQVVSVVMGALMVISVAFPALFGRLMVAEKPWFSAVFNLKKRLGKALSIRSLGGLFLVGMLNGLLPCGLVYIAIAGAIASGGLWLGAAYMVLFGLGTIPMLLAITLAGNLMSLPLRNKINKLIPVLVFVVGIFFILRGLNLGIPFLSPTKERIEKKFENSLKENELSEGPSARFFDYFRA